MPEDDRMNSRELQAAAAAIIAGGRRLGARGLIVAAEGNLSVRVGDRLLVTPSGRRKDELVGDNLLLLTADPTGPAIDPDRPDLRPTSDLRIHRAIYAARPDVRAVAHAHLPASLALTLAGEVPDPAVLPETALFLPRLPVLALMTMGSPALAEAVAAALGDGTEPNNAVLLERHGAVAVGLSVDAAVDRLELVELLCRVWRDARLLGWRPPGQA
ncbi:MAG: L-fuculose-phosphate aldolase [Chloroflexota bacterium]|jgi:L-fuculose-phosphate aldolase|nr:L-fuculose-phosphate aldolase [Chloroflexota bacterium]